MITEIAWLPDELLAQIDADHGRNANPLARLNLWPSSQAVALCGNSVAGFSGISEFRALHYPETLAERLGGHRRSTSASRRS